MIKCLLIIQQCNPEWASVPLVGYNFFNGISKRTDATLVTHIRNRQALEKVRCDRKIVYIPESTALQKYYKIISKFILKGNVNWPVAHALGYPVFAEFDHRVYALYKEKVSQGHYDIVHSLTPILPRYPAKIIDACAETPFILGPVNGGIPFPEAFKKQARQEFAQFNFLRFFTHIIPGYARTYRKATKVLAGSSFTMNLLENMFCLKPPQIELFFENGISRSHFRTRVASGSSKDSFNILFVGRLVPYKGADMLIDAFSRIDSKIRDALKLTIVGDGPEMENLKAQARSHKMLDRINFTGWITHEETAGYYESSDLFCFPSVREFGGAVVLEAMACGLPCIVVNHGGIGEYVTDECGFKINPLSKDHLIAEMADKITTLFSDKELYKRLSGKSLERAQDFEWETKAEKIAEIYEQVLKDRQNMVMLTR
ncbi:MAG: glycosyltransferase family 4 protein [Deltaproteobacteria bacterium]|nr:glycosyltransferase family 4 protein [Deltaproteobacteria bacterium]